MSSDEIRGIDFIYPVMAHNSGPVYAFEQHIQGDAEGEVLQAVLKDVNKEMLEKILLEILKIKDDLQEIKRNTKPKYSY